MVFLSRKNNMGLWAEKEQPISESQRAVMSSLLFACSQHIVNPPLFPKACDPKLLLLNSSSSWRSRPEKAQNPNSMWDPFPLFLPVCTSLVDHPLLHVWWGSKMVSCRLRSNLFRHSCRRASGKGNYPHHEMQVGSSCKKATRGSNAFKVAL